MSYFLTAGTETKRRKERKKEKSRIAMELRVYVRDSTRMGENI
jgi:hypothetical protein